MATVRRLSVSRYCYTTGCDRSRHRGYLSPNSTCCVTSRHVTIRQARVVRVVTWCAVSCVLRRACSNMADDEEAVVLACKTISCFFIIYNFSSQMKIFSFLKRISGDHNFIHITNKLSFISRLSRSWWRTCRACCARRDALCRAVTCCVALAVQHAWHSTYDFFLY